MAMILTVCTGNICRSPAAELLLGAHLGEDVEVASAGTHALTGYGIPEEMLVELNADGIDGASHEGRLLTERMMREADAIIAMAREHRQYAVQLAPYALKKTFTLAELAASAGTGATLAGSTVAERLSELPGAVAAHRHVLAGFDLDDVPDPYRRPQASYHRSYGMIRGGVVEIAAWLRGDAAQASAAS